MEYKCELCEELTSREKCVVVLAINKNYCMCHECATEWQMNDSYGSTDSEIIRFILTKSRETKLKILMGN